MSNYSRTAEEAHFHDEQAADVSVDQIDVEKTFTAYTAVENQKALRFLGPVKDLRLLDAGCGYGEASVYFSRQGAEVTGIDVSEQMLKLASQLAARYEVHPTFQKYALENLPFPDASFDRVYGFGVLHHVDWKKAIQEIHRVLKPGAKAALIEPIAYNPIVNIYRRMTTRFRSPDERPFTRRDLNSMINAFARGWNENCWLLGQAVFCYMYLIEGVHPNEAPYWKKVISDASRYRAWLELLLRWDETVTRIPVLKWLSYSTVICLEK